MDGLIGFAFGSIRHMRLNFKLGHYPIIGSLSTSALPVLTKAGYSAYGENATTTSGAFRYTGQRFDAETAGSAAEPSGLYYYRSRVYSPALGRFFQPDPSGYGNGPAGMNLNAYVDNDPLDRTDPSGKVALVDNLIGAGIGFGTDFLAQVIKSYLTGQPFSYNYTEGGIAAGLGFATSGLSSFAEASIEGAGITGAYAIGGNIAANGAIGTASSVAQTALLNNAGAIGDVFGLHLQSQNGSYSDALLLGWQFVVCRSGG